MNQQQQQQEDKCDMGCKRYTGFESRHLPTCHYYADSLSRKYDEMDLKLAEMKKVLEGYEQWEADIISDNRCWEPEGSACNPTMTNDIWIDLMRLQKLRNIALYGTDTPNAVKHQTP